MAVINTTIQLLSKNYADLVALGSPWIPLDGQMICIKDMKRYAWGDGVTQFTSLPTHPLIEWGLNWDDVDVLLSADIANTDGSARFGFINTGNGFKIGNGDLMFTMNDSDDSFGFTTDNGNYNTAYVYLNQTAGIEMFFNSNKNLNLNSSLISLNHSTKILFNSPEFKFSNGNILLDSGNGIDLTPTAGTDTLNIGTSAGDVINIGYSSSQINIQGTLAYQNVTNYEVKDKLITLNKGGATASGVSTGFEIEENNSITGWFTTNGTRDGFELKAPAAYKADFLFSSLTANRIFTYPNNTGTLLIDSGSYSNPSWLASLDWSKISGTPTTLSGYGITDAVPSSRTININGTSQDLSADRTFNVYIKSPVHLSTQWSYTGGTSEQKVLGVELTGLLQANDIFRFLFSIGANSNANTKTFRAYINTSNAIGGTQIAIQQLTTNSLMSTFGRDLSFQGSLSSQLIAPTTTNFSHYLITSTSLPTALSINFSGTVWFILTAQLSNSADTAYVHFGQSEIYRQ